MRTWFSTRPLLSRVAAVLLAFVVAAVLVIPAEAYTPAIKRWPRPATTYSFRDNFPGGYRSTARQAEADWVRGPGPDFRFDEVSSNGNVQLYYGKFTFPRVPDDVLGYTDPKSNGLWMTGANIVISPDFNWFSDDTELGLVEPAFNQYALRTHLGHELGHALGIGHGSDRYARMYYLLKPGKTSSVNTNDTIVIDYLYNTNFDGERPEYSGLPEWKYYPLGHISGSAQEGHGSITYAGGWDRWEGKVSPRASGAALILIANKPGAKILVPYQGRCITRVYSASRNRGDVEVRIDGSYKETYSERIDSTHWQAEKNFCASYNGQHTIEFKTSCTRADCYFDSDRYYTTSSAAVAAAEVKGASQSSEGTTYQQDHDVVNYIGNWKTFEAEDASNGKLAFTENRWDAVNFAFKGTQVEYCYSKAFNRGKASILIDGEPVDTIDLYSNEVERNQCWVSPELKPDLGREVHYIHIAATGEKHENSSGTLIDVDHFIVH